jgi:hypothetical protein
MKLFSRKEKPSKKYTYQHFLIHKEERLKDALAERIAAEMLSDKSKAQ